MNSKRIMIGACFLSISFLYAMEQKKDVKINVGGQVYSLTREQASQSETLERMLKKHTDPEEVIVLPEGITSKVFDYIYKDLTNQNYDENDLDDKMLAALFNAAITLKIPSLIEKYTEITTDRITDITIEVGNKEYVLSIAQAKKSNTLKNILADVEDYSLPIPLPNLSEEVFDYVYKDLTNSAYDSDSLSDETLVDLVNAANYLDSEKLLKKYQDLLVIRLTSIDTAKKLEEYENLIQRLPEEMQIPLSQNICTLSKELYQTMQQSHIELVKDREQSGEQIIISPDTSICVVINTSDVSTVFDLVKNKKLWQSKALNKSKIVFSSDSSRLLSYKEGELTLFDTYTGKQLWKKNYSILPNNIPRFFSGPNRIVIQVLESKKIQILDSLTGDILFDLPHAAFRIINSYYESDSKSLIIEYQDWSTIYVSAINIDTGQEIKNAKSDFSNEKLYISPDGKKIIKVSKELFTLENSTNGNDPFTWAFKKPLIEIPSITSFSKDNSLFVLGSTAQNFIFVFNMLTGKIQYEKSNIFDEDTKHFLTFFRLVRMNCYYSQFLFLIQLLLWI